MAHTSKPALEQAMASNVYFDRVHDIQAAKILPGEYYATTQHMLLVTVLGSCVAACLRDKVNGIGGMNHFMLPGSNSETVAAKGGRYGIDAMEMLLGRLQKLGAERRNIEARVFGGAAVIASMTETNVGERNAKFVLDFLQAEKIAVVSQDLLDVCPRKVYFFPSTGKAVVKKLRNLHNTTIEKREQAYRSHLQSLTDRTKSGSQS
ncbi:MAG TPA: chemoreceptor glutamine deamidase CheD [Novimethylophilus sp.]|uniref:chemoreceptor glutamine deamidase CheD n=1 Tax=Novimethylophilus sp. TaxID=2137426 RepID=UPI002F3FD243